jgi:hypothetical protein
MFKGWWRRSAKVSYQPDDTQYDDPNNYKQRRKTPCFSSEDTPHLLWVEV